MLRAGEGRRYKPESSGAGGGDEVSWVGWGEGETSERERCAVHLCLVFFFSSSFSLDGCMWGGEMDGWV